MAQRSNEGPAKYVELTGADQQAVTGSAVLIGMSVSGGATGPKVNIHDGTANSDPLVASITVAANGSGTLMLGPNGVALADGIYVDVVSGNATGSLLYR